MTQALAYIHPEAKIAPSVQIGPFVCIEEDVEIGEGTIIDSNVTICSGTRIGKNCHVFPGAVIGAIPQDLKFKGEKTYVRIGDRTTLREFVTVHRGTASKGETVVGDDCLIMAYCHVAHDCRLGNHIIMSNATQLAGEVVVDDWAIIGGGSLVHQFTHIGGHPIAYCGINSVGLRRRNFTHEQIDAIQDVYRLIFSPMYNVSQAVEHVMAELPESAERDTIVNFIKSSPRGILRGPM